MKAPQLKFIAIVAGAALLAITSAAMAQDHARSKGAGSETIIINSPDGPTLQTREALRQAQQTGVKMITLKLQNVGLIQDEILMRLIIDELHGIMEEYGYSKGGWTLIRCSEACE